MHLVRDSSSPLTKSNSTYQAVVPTAVKTMGMQAGLSWGNLILRHPHIKLDQSVFLKFHMVYLQILWTARVQYINSWKKKNHKILLYINSYL